MAKFDIPQSCIYMCLGSKCQKRGSKEYYKDLRSYIKKKGLKHQIEIIKTECTDRCKFAPVLSAHPGNFWLKEYSAKELEDLVRLLRTQGGLE